MFRVKLVEQPMPTGSKDTDTLLEWLIDSLSLVRRKSETWNVMMNQVHYIECFEGHY